ncbi:NUDIX hydrolase [Psychrobacter sp. FDAARGOS_221]|uniref:NUDIX hydrolase n=1 Tax=Psychrobacter sp. FDAARGOS_221 TaxID=1975705 RepID=UPI000BB54161|nr:CoA pyrophosphatase [Psychrobacter sp. FDAARGOS_221]PNK60293.1 CoA pyrophosphatase [Psychrobacter sp. FDAARGOS_221]
MPDDLNDLNHHQNYKTALSARFEELAVVLPEQVSQPTLKQLVTRVQNNMLQQQQGSGEIAHAQRLLQQMLNSPKADASVLVLITNEPKPKMLLTRRAAHLNSHAGEVSFAGGKHEAEDGNNVVTALREACEETALPPKKAQIVGQLPTEVSKKGLIVRPIVALVEPPITYVPELGEISRIFWADFEQLITQPIVDHILPYKLGDQTIMIRTPSWQVDGEVVWGLTGRILSSLLDIGFDRKVPWYYEPADTDAKIPPSS